MKYHICTRGGGGSSPTFVTNVNDMMLRFILSILIKPLEFLQWRSVEKGALMKSKLRCTFGEGYTSIYPKV